MRRLAFVLLLVASSISGETLRVGVALGFPPYQDVQGGRPVGLDVVLADAILRESGDTAVWVARPWDEILGLLRTSHDLDLVIGMEQSGDRGVHFLLGEELYLRKNALFVLDSSPQIRSLDDLGGRAVAGDRDAFGELELAQRGLKADVRLVRTSTKEVAFEALAAGRVEAALMPEAVGRALARASGVSVRLIDLGDPGTPVGLAVRRGRPDLLVRLNAATARLERSGTLRALRESYLR